MSTDSITLDVSGFRYRTRKSVLYESPYFKNFFARWENCADIQPDGSLYIDANPLTFQHLLDFMRRPSVFPLFWTKESGFNYALYTSLGEEADFVQLKSLRDWIREGGYTKAITIETKTRPTIAGSETGEATVNYFVIPRGGNYFTCPDGTYGTAEPLRCRHTPGWIEQDPQHQLQWIRPKKELHTVVTRVILNKQALQNPDCARRDKIVIANGSTKIE